MVAEIDATTTGVGARVPVSVRNLRFNGPVRVIVTDLTPDAPGYGAVLLSLPSRPEVAMLPPTPTLTPTPTPTLTLTLATLNPISNPNPNPAPTLTITLTLTRWPSTAAWPTVR